MSFFFDVWAYDGFVLASDVRMMVNGAQAFGHKLQTSSPSSKVTCAIAVCGDYPDACLGFFSEAIITKDTLRDVAHLFATRWTNRYAGTQDYSAVHIAGYERTTEGLAIPQMWYFTTGYSDEDHHRNLASFSDRYPLNNHIPWKVKELTGAFPNSTPEDENQVVRAFLRIHEPFFTWNGDPSFWGSAGDAVTSAIRLLRRFKGHWTLEECAQLTSHCLTFLASVGRLLPESTVGVSPAGEFDLLCVEENGARWISCADLPNETRETA